MDMSELEKRITRLEDIEAIKQLKVRYSHICDDMHNPDTIASVFAEDGIWESADFGRAVGHAEIRALFRKFQQMFSFSQHNMMNPLIEVNGNRATGVWYIMGPWDATDGSGKRWFALRYDDEYVKINGQWKYQHLKVALRMNDER
ncbi:MAG: nuclear transport factor 2 family protein [Gammaproteobacteria bacterium]